LLESAHETAATSSTAVALVRTGFCSGAVWLDREVEQRLPDVNPRRLTNAWLGVIAARAP